MKKTARHAFTGALMLLVLVALLSVASFAEAVDTIAGTVRASTLSPADIVLQGDTTLIMDADLTLRSIRGNYDLAIRDEGGHTLTVVMPMSDNVITANGSGHGISVKSLTCDANLDIKARKDGLNIDGDIHYTAGTLAVTCGGDAVYSRNGSVYLTGVSSAMLEAKGSCLYAVKGTVRFEGASLFAKSTGSDSFGVAGNNIVLSVTDKATVTAKANAIVSGGGAGIWLSGKFEVTGGHNYGYAVQAKDTGSLVLAEGTELTAVSDGGGLWAGASVQMLGDGKLDITAKNKTGVCAESGSLELKGSVKVNAKKQALLAKNGAVSVNGSVNAQSSESGTACIMGDSVSITGVSLYASAKASTILSTGEEGITLNLSGPITAVSDSANSSVLDAKFGGDVSVTGGAGSKLIGTGYGIYATGEVSVSGKVKVEAVKDAIHADGDGVWITGDIELSTESEKYTGVYTSAADADIQLVKYGSLTVTSAGRGIYTKGKFHKDSTGVLNVEAADTAIEAKTINIFNHKNTVTSENEFGLKAAENVNIENCNLAINAYKSCIYVGSPDVEGSLSVEGSSTSLSVTTTIQLDWHDWHNIGKEHYTSAIFVNGDALLADGYVDADCLYSYPILVYGPLSIAGRVRAHSTEKSAILAYKIELDEALYIAFPENGQISNGKLVGREWVNSTDGSLHVIYATNRVEWKPQISGSVSIKTSVGSSTVAQPMETIMSSLTDVPDGEMTYQWQSSPDNVNWTDLEGQTDKEIYVRAKHTGLWLRLAVSVKNHVGALYSNAIMVPESTMLEGGIVYTSGAKVGGRLTTARTGLLKTMEDTAPASVRFRWQHSPNGENYWEDVDGATNTYYNITAADVGTWLRLVATVDGMTGKVVSPAKMIGKAPAGDTVAMSGLTYAEGVVTVTRAFANQEYVMTLSAGEPSASEWQNAVSPAATGALTFPVSGNYLNNSVYVHTRLKETETTLAGTKVKCSCIYTGEGGYLAGLVLKNSSGSPVSNENTKVGRSVSVTVSPLPDTYPDAQWSSQTVNWYVNNNPSYPGAVELYKDSACTQPLERDAYGVIKPTTRHTVYYKAASWTNYVMIGASKTVGANQIVDAHMILNVSNENDEYILQSMYFESIEAFPGDEIITGFTTRPEKSYLGTLTFRARSTNPASALTVTADTATRKVTVTVPENAVPGIYSYDYLIDGVKPANGTYIVVSVKEKTATVSFDDGKSAPLSEARLLTVGMESETVPLGAQYILPENAFDAPEGYEFDGWDKGEAGDGIDVTEDVTVTAKWKKHIHNMVHEPGYDNTCTAPGRMEHWYCEDCGGTFGDEAGNYPIANAEFLMIPASGHDTTGVEAVRINEVSATCTADGGYDTVKHCTVCGEIAESTHTTIPATGHVEGEAVRENEFDATCTENGRYDEVVYCTVCGDEISRETVTVPATGHMLNHVSAADATCTEDGHIAHYLCTVCGELFAADAQHTPLTAREVTLDAPGHNFGAWTVTKPASASAEGKESRTCARCHETETRLIPKTGDVAAASLDSASGVLSWSAYLPDDGKVYSVLTAWYDVDGRLLGTRFDPYAGDGALANGAFAVGEGAKTVKLFVLDDDLRPLMSAVSKRP